MNGARQQEDDSIANEFICVTPRLTSFTTGPLPPNVYRLPSAHPLLLPNRQLPSRAPRHIHMRYPSIFPGLPFSPIMGKVPPRSPSNCIQTLFKGCESRIVPTLVFDPTAAKGFLVLPPRQRPEMFNLTADGRVWAERGSDPMSCIAPVPTQPQSGPPLYSRRIGGLRGPL